MNGPDQQWRNPIAAIGRWSAVAAGCGLVLALFLPWVRSGSALRSSFETWRTADRLGVLDGPAPPLLAAFLVAVPALVGGVAVATLTGRRIVALALALLVGGVVGVGAVLVLTSSARAESGARLALVCSVAMVAGALLAGVGRRGRDERHG